MKKRLARNGQPNATRYKVGYGHPPTHTRFKPGRSGNPKGRPRDGQSLNSLFFRILNEKISVREGDKVRLISKFEAMMRSLALKAVRGDLKAMATVIALAEE